MANESRSSRAAWRAGALALTVAAMLWTTPAAAGPSGPGYKCLGAVGGRQLDGPTNVGIPGEFTQGDAAGSWLISCSYPDAGSTWEYEVAWTPPRGAEPTFEGCGSKPNDPTATWVSAKRFAYTSTNNHSIPPLAAVARGQLAVVEKLAKPCAAPGTTTTQATTTTTAAKSAAIATLTGIVGDVTVKLAGTTTYVPVTPDTVLHVGDDISTDVDASVIVHLPAGQVTLYELSYIRINEMFVGTDLVRLQVLLRSGRVEAGIPEHSLIRTDFAVQTPVATASIRGSAMVVSVTKAGVTTVHTTQDQAFVQGTADAVPMTVLEGRMSTIGTDGVASAPVAFSASTPKRSTPEAPAESSSALAWIVIALVAIAIVGAVLVSTRGRVRLR